MQFRLWRLLFGVTILCTCFAMYSYWAYKRPVQLWVDGCSWAIIGPTAYNVSIESIEVSDSDFGSEVTSHGPTTIRVLGFQPNQISGSRFPNAIGNGKRFAFPLQMQHELMASDHTGKDWKYKIVFHERPFFAGLLSISSIVNVFVIICALALVLLLRTITRTRRATGVMEPQPTDHAT